MRFIRVALTAFAVILGSRCAQSSDAPSHDACERLLRADVSLPPQIVRAAAALVAARDPQGALDLARDLARAPAWSARLAAREVLLALAPDLVGSLIADADAFRDDAVWIVRRAMVESSFRASSEAAFVVIERALNDPMAPVRRAALVAAAGFDEVPRRVGEVVRERLADPAPEVTEAALTAALAWRRRDPALAADLAAPLWNDVDFDREGPRFLAALADVESGALDLPSRDGATFDDAAAIAALVNVGDHRRARTLLDCARARFGRPQRETEIDSLLSWSFAEDAGADETLIETAQAGASCGDLARAILARLPQTSELGRRFRRDVFIAVATAGRWTVFRALAHAVRHSVTVDEELAAAALRHLGEAPDHYAVDADQGRASLVHASCESIRPPSTPRLLELLHDAAWPLSQLAALSELVSRSRSDDATLVALIEALDADAAVRRRLYSSLHEIVVASPLLARRIAERLASDDEAPIVRRLEAINSLVADRDDRVATLTILRGIDAGGVAEFEQALRAARLALADESAVAEVLNAVNDDARPLPRSLRLCPAPVVHEAVLARIAQSTDFSAGGEIERALDALAPWLPPAAWAAAATAALRRAQEAALAVEPEFLRRLTASSSPLDIGAILDVVERTLVPAHAAVLARCVERGIGDVALRRCATLALRLDAELPSDWSGHEARADLLIVLTMAPDATARRRLHEIVEAGAARSAGTAEDDLAAVECAAIGLAEIFGRGESADVSRAAETFFRSEVRLVRDALLAADAALEADVDTPRLLLRATTPRHAIDFRLGGLAAIANSVRDGDLIDRALERGWDALSAEEHALIDAVVFEDWILAVVRRVDPSPSLDFLTRRLVESPRLLATIDQRVLLRLCLDERQPLNEDHRSRIFAAIERRLGVPPRADMAAHGIEADIEWFMRLPRELRRTWIDLPRPLPFELDAMPIPLRDGDRRRGIEARLRRSGRGAEIELR